MNWYYTWDSQAIYLSGFQSNQNYSLICWNLLTPHHEPERIRVQNLEQDTIAVPLHLSTGIYHIQIQGRSIQDLGCWCDSNKYDSLRNLTEPDEDLEKYCHTILDCESTENFIAASKKLAINRQRIKSMLSSLQLNPCIFPNWLNQISLQKKLEAFLKISPPPEPEPTPPPTPPLPIIVGKWYLIRTAPYKREIFSTLLKTKMNTNEFKVLILEYGVPIDRGYRNNILVRSDNLQGLKSFLKSIPFFESVDERKPLTIVQANRMLGHK